MYPMDYEEFLWAQGDTITAPILRQVLAARRPLGDAVHRKILRSFRLYMLVGGMPQAVDEYLNTNNFKRVDAVKRDILSLYQDDFHKIDSTGRLSLLFDSIPAELNKNASRYSGIQRPFQRTGGRYSYFAVRAAGFQDSAGRLSC